MSKDPSVAKSWDAYWQGAQTDAAYARGGSSHPTVLAFWSRYFDKLNARLQAPRILDVASGSGAVIASAQRKLAPTARLTCVDISAAAVQGVTERLPEIRGIVADAAKLPLAIGQYDVVTSQFGVEYAGQDAFAELTRLLLAGGELALLVHRQDGLIYQQCAASLAAVNSLQELGFTQRCRAMFAAGFAVLSGGDRSEYADASKRFAPCLRAAESALRQYGTEVADGTVLMLYQDVRDIHRRLRHYEEADLMNWLSSMETELSAYAGRMASMCQAAIDETTFGGIQGDLLRQGFEIVQAQPLLAPQQELPLCWALIARKPYS